MQRTIITLFVLFFGNQAAFSQTEVSGEVSGVWTKVNSPYIVVDNLLVTRSSSLTIEPGVEVRFNNSKSMNIDGALNAIGTATDSIVFKRNGNDRWGWLHFTLSKSDLRYVVIDGGSTGLNCYYSQVKVSDSRIVNNYISGYDVNGSDARLEIVQSVLENNSRNHFFGTGDVIVINSVIQNNSTQIGSTLECSAGGRTIISNSIIQKNSAESIFSSSAGGQFQIVNSVIYDNTAKKKSLVSGTIQNSILRGNNLIDEKSISEVEYSNIEGGFAGIGNIDTAPLFSNPASSDFSLQASSPCINSGNPSVFYNDNDRTRNDMGVNGGSGILPIPANLKLDFGPAKPGEKLNFMIYNFRDTDFLLREVTFSSPQNFSSDFNPVASIASGSNLTIAVQYNSTNSGSFDETISFSSPDFIGGDNPTVRLTGFSGTYGEVTGTWTKTNSPYLITGDLLVPKGRSLTIEPGVEVKFAGYFELKVQGLLRAEGTEADSIVFSPDHPDSAWCRIWFAQADENSILSYVKILKAGSNARPDYHLNSSKVVFVDRSKLLIRHALLRENSGDMGIIQGYQGQITLVNSRLVSNYKGIYLFESSAIVQNTTIEETEFGGAFEGFKASFLLNQSMLIENDWANHLITSKVVMNNCTGYRNSKNNFPKRFLILDNTSSALITNSIIWDSAVIQVGFESSANVSYSDVEGGYAGEGNIDAAPLFVDPGNGNFSLQPGSPAVDAGNPSVFFNDGNGSRNDMGATGSSGLVVTPTTVDFGPTGRGQKKSASIFISNFRANNFELSTATLSENTNFTLSASLPLTIEPLAKDSIVVNINPTVSAQLDEKIIFTSPHFLGNDSATIALHALAGAWQGPVSGNWSLANSPVILGGEVTVPSGLSLSIDPGVEVLVDTTIAGSKARFIVEGSLIAEGTASNPIIFSVLPAQAAPGIWQGILLRLGNSATAQAIANSNEMESISVGPATRNTLKKLVPTAEMSANQIQTAGTARLVYCEIKNAVTGITAESDQVYIENCTISENSQDGIKWNGDEISASGETINSTIENNGGWGIYCFSFAYTEYGTANPILSGNTIRNNRNGGIFLHALGGSPFSWRSTVDIARTAPLIEQNTIRDNFGPGIDGSADGTWTDGFPFDHYSYAYVEPEISGNIIASNQGGILTKSPGYGNGRRLSYSTVNIDRTTIWGNADTSLSAKDSAEVTLKNTIVWNAGSSAFSVESGGMISAIFSDIHGGQAGEGNIDADPLFVDPSNADFRLQASSPAIDAGDPTSPLDADNTRADMGAIPFLQQPGKPVAIAPADDSLAAPTTLVFVWHSTLRAATYGLEISQDSTFASGDTVREELSDTTTTITGLLPSTIYFWRVQASNIAGPGVWSDTLTFTTAVPVSVEAEREIPKAFSLSQNYPNPFNPSTTIYYTLPKREHVKIKIFDIYGREILTLVDEEKSAGYYSVVWKGKNSYGYSVPSGLYFFQITAGNFKNTRPMTLLK